MRFSCRLAGRTGERWKERWRKKEALPDRPVRRAKEWPESTRRGFVCTEARGMRNDVMTEQTQAGRDEAGPRFEVMLKCIT